MSSLAALRARQERHLTVAWRRYCRRPWVVGDPIPETYWVLCTAIAEVRAAAPASVFRRMLKRVVQSYLDQRAEAMQRRIARSRTTVHCPACSSLVPFRRIRLRQGDVFLGWIGEGGDRAPGWGRQGVRAMSPIRGLRLGLAKRVAESKRREAVLDPAGKVGGAAKTRTAR